MGETVREPMGIKRIHDWPHVERIAADTRAALEGTAFERAWSAGRALSPEEAMSEALTIADEVTKSADG
jgi:hypothetical protein